MSQVFINDVLTEVGQGADEIISLRWQLDELKANAQAVLQTQSEAWQREVAESQAREAKLREALKVVISFALSDACVGDTDDLCYEFRMAANAISVSQDDTALREIIAKAGEVMRARCESKAWNYIQYEHDERSADSCHRELNNLPPVTLEDLK